MPVACFKDRILVIRDGDGDGDGYGRRVVTTSVINVLGQNDRMLKTRVG